MALILIVDDDDMIRNALYELLEEHHLCHTAENAKKAISFLEEEEYDVVLSDLSMPGLSGLELLAYIRQRQPNTPVIIISGIGDTEHSEGIFNMGAFHYLLKPFKLDDVEASIERALEYRRLLIEGKGGFGEQPGETTSSHP